MQEGCIVMDKSNRCLLRIFCCFTVLIILLLLQFRFASVYGDTVTSIQSKDEILHLEEEILNMSRDGDERIESVTLTMQSRCIMTFRCLMRKRI